MSRPFRRTDLSRGSAANPAGILEGRRSGGPIWQRQCHGPCGDRRKEAVGRVGLAEIVEVRQSAGPICRRQCRMPCRDLGRDSGRPDRSVMETVPRTSRGSWAGRGCTKEPACGLGGVRVGWVGCMWGMWSVWRGCGLGVGWV